MLTPGQTFQFLMTDGRTNTLTVVARTDRPTVSYYEVFEHETEATKYFNAPILEKLVAVIYKPKPAKVIPITNPLNIIYAN